ncbi:hypothetical protein [Pseudobacteriovorax antillogorgiicola]|uniref:Porin n=1 Tax=Pseudobacteriovorax antillogorgiicola TaxID=1513793 RepID=A0A1Y6CBK9_9BACT|nr:hypothetical protein [Pseudobacteriovorax antillogorgiicola]TCS48963.1 hypothetical protein EDD56_1165 [Pseudobacteriovorax antillogorgiicola]SMF53667.1 hypothetical protein SAMN06296036_116149 [Pseudobacteriovorax antillogorgiicola]
MKAKLLLIIPGLCLPVISYSQSELANSITTEARLRVDARHRQTTIDSSGTETTSEYTGLEIQSMELIVKGKYTPRTSFAVNIKGEQANVKNNEPLRSGNNAFKFFKINHKITDSLNLVFGKIHVRRGAYSAQTPKFHTYRFDSIMAYLPAKFQTGAGLVYKFSSHNMNLQFLNGDNNKLESSDQQTGEDLSYQLQIDSNWGLFNTRLNGGISNYARDSGETLTAKRRSQTNTSIGISYPVVNYYLNLDYVVANIPSYQSLSTTDDGTESLVDQSQVTRDSMILMVGTKKGEWQPKAKIALMTEKTEGSDSLSKMDANLGIEYHPDSDQSMRYSIMYIIGENENTSSKTTTEQDILISLSSHLK